MKEGKINVLILILLLVVILIIGIGIGYVISQNVGQIEEKGYRVEGKEFYENEKINENKEKNENEQVEKMKYDGSKNITIEGKTYTVSYLSEKFKNVNNNELEQTEVKLYLNDKKIKTLNLGYLIDVGHTFGNKDYEVELHQFCEKYILIEVKQKHDDGEYETVNRRTFCIVNTNGEHIQTFKWDDATQIFDIQTNEQFTYKIDNNGLILYKTIDAENDTNEAIEIKYTVIRDFIKDEIVQFHKNIGLAGK